MLTPQAIHGFLTELGLEPTSSDVRHIIDELDWSGSGVVSRSSSSPCMESGQLCCKSTLCLLLQAHAALIVDWVSEQLQKHAACLTYWDVGHWCNTLVNKNVSCLLATTNQQYCIMSTKIQVPVNRQGRFRSFFGGFKRRLLVCL